jgi:hypothetical protein
MNNEDLEVKRARLKRELDQIDEDQRVVSPRDSAGLDAIRKRLAVIREQVQSLDDTRVMQGRQTPRRRA